jgi:hypothetical protein
MILALGIGFSLLCLALFGTAAFFLAKGLARALAAVSRRFLAYTPPVPALRVASWACALLVLILVPMKGCSHWQASLYRQAIPPQFGPLELLHHDEISSFREGCGFAIFRLSDKDLARIRNHGLAHLETARLGRDGDPYHQYKPWSATPAPKNEHLFRGESCTDAPPALLQQAQQAADKKGAFFTTGHEQDLVVVPALGILVYSYNG